jgi:hypothetical protein
MAVFKEGAGNKNENDDDTREIKRKKGNKE